LAVVHHDDPVRQADLRGGQADAYLVPHGLGHVRDDPLDLRGDLADRRGYLPLHRFAIQSHRQQGHWASLLWTISRSLAGPSLLLPYRPRRVASRAAAPAEAPADAAGPAGP